MKRRILLTPAEASEHFKLSLQSLRRSAKLGQIKAERTPGGTRRYVIYEDVPDEDAAAIEADKVAEQEALNDERRKLKKEIAKFDATPEKDKSELETGFMKFSLRPRLEELEKICSQN